MERKGLCETGWKIKGDWQIRGCAGPVLANWLRRGSNQGLSTPVNVLLLCAAPESRQVNGVGERGRYVAPVSQKNVLLKT